MGKGASSASSALAQRRARSEGPVSRRVRATRDDDLRPTHRVPGPMTAKSVMSVPSACIPGQARRLPSSIKTSTTADQVERCRLSFVGLCLVFSFVHAVSWLVPSSLIPFVINLRTCMFLVHLQITLIVLDMICIDPMRTFAIRKSGFQGNRKACMQNDWDEVSFQKLEFQELHVTLKNDLSILV